MNQHAAYGLLNRDKNEQSCPLLSVDAKVAIDDNYSHVTVRQTYVNNSAESIEAVYKFPLADDAKVTGFTAMFGENKVIGQFMQTDAARNEYESAISKGNSAVFIEQQRDDRFEIFVGNIAVEEVVSIEISYLQQIIRTDDEIRWTLPSVIAPRYMPKHDKKSDPEHFQLVHGEANYKLTLQVEWTSMERLSAIESPSHELSVHQHGEKWTITFAEQQVALDRDVVLIAKLKDDMQNTSVAADLEDFALAKLKFRVEAGGKVQTVPTDYVFMIDNSGSMSGDKFGQAKQALQLAIRNMEMQDTFNVLSFESNYELFANEPVSYSQESLERASNWIKNMRTKGGTEIYEPLKYLFESYPAPNERMRVIMLFTDGQVSNEQQIMNLIRKHQKHTRLFSFGIDTAVNQFFIKGIADAGNGLPEFIYPGERIEDKVIRQFSRIHAESILTKGVFTADGKELKTLPELPSRLFADENYEILVEAKHMRQLTDIIVKGTTADQQPWSIPFNAPVVGDARLLGLQWAKCKIENYERKLATDFPFYYDANDHMDEQKQALINRIVAISSQYGLMSNYTSLVAVYEREDKLSEQPPRHIVPLSVPALWEDEPPFMSLLADSVNNLSGMSFSENKISKTLFSVPERLIKKSIDSFARFVASDVDELRAAAMKQNANGSFGSGADSIKKTAWFIFGCLQFNEKRWSLYRKQLEKAGKWLLHYAQHQTAIDLLLIVCASNRLADLHILKHEGELQKLQSLTAQLDTTQKAVLADIEQKKYLSVVAYTGAHINLYDDFGNYFLSGV